MASSSFIWEVSAAAISLQQTVNTDNKVVSLWNYNKKPACVKSGVNSFIFV